MSIDRNLEDLRHRYEQASTQELLQIVREGPGEYREDALELAATILDSRRVSRDEMNDLALELERGRAEAAAEADVPLGRGMRIICFAFAVPGILIAAYQTKNRRTRRAREAWIAVGLGWAVWIAIILLSISW